MGCLSKGGTMVRFIKFAGVGLVAGTVDISLVWALTKFIFGGYYGQMVVSPVISYECSIIVGFVFSWYFIWNDRLSTGGRSEFWKRLAAYNVSNVGIFALRVLLVMMFEKIWDGGNLVIINTVSRILAGLLNFVITDKLIFKKK
ncbi:MAG: GtrA family protein [Bacteroidales bacterium]|nr:GtrA family protein [Bacteroidales bacterium]